MIRKIIIVVSVIIILIGLFALWSFWSAGEFRTMEPFALHSFKEVKGFPGAEDFQIDHKTGMLLGSFHDRRAEMEGEQARSGIFAYNLTDPHAVPLEIETDYNGDLTPHGISLHHEPDGTKYLFVVNMGRDAHFFESVGECTVEIFEYRDDRLYHLEKIESPELTSPNNILAVGPREFYVTIDHGWNSPTGRTLESFLQLPISYVLYYDGENFEKAAGRITYANGIAMSPGGETVYVGATVGRRIHVYSRNSETGELTETKQIRLGSGVDNIDVHPDDGSIWACCIPQLLTFMSHSKDHDTLAPVEVIRLLPLKDGSYDIRRVYTNDGKEISASSIAVKWEDRLIVGTIYEDYFLDGHLLPGKTLDDAIIIRNNLK